MAWLLVPCVLLGGAEWVAHLLQWLLVCVAVLCTVRIGVRIGLGSGPARIAGLLVAGAPAMVGMATTCMSDVPAGAFAAIAMERFLAWHEEHRPMQGAAAALAFACAGLARSHALALPLVALALLGGPAPWRRRWVDALPRECAETDARVCLARAWAALGLGVVAEMEIWLRAAERAPRLRDNAPRAVRHVARGRHDDQPERRSHPVR